ncbi:MAG TPA: hypothetical protein VGV06_14170 [Methylomirabilota bacterium]|nr:hypothetical protein [Methylomirabilota bacterium]
MAETARDGAELRMDQTSLYREETYTDRRLGALPLTFEIEAGSLGEATENFAAGAKVAAERAVKELQEMRREAALPIIILDRVPPGLGGPDGPRGSGNIQLR